MAINEADLIDGSEIPDKSSVADSAWIVPVLKSDGTDEGGVTVARLGQLIGVNVRAFGAVGDGVADDSVAFQNARAAINSAGRGRLYIPAGTYRLVSAMGAFTVPVSIEGEGADVTTLALDHGAGTIKIIESVSSGFSASDFSIDGSAVTETLSGNQYAFFLGGSETKFRFHSINRVRVKNFVSSADKSPLYSTPLGAHVIYVDNVEHVSICDCLVEDTLGAAVFARDVKGLRVERNAFIRNYWYPVNLESGVVDFSIKDNVFQQDFAEGVYWGGAINLTSQVGESLCERGTIFGNDFSGNYSYGGVIRLQSAIDVEVASNSFHDFGIGSQLPGASQTISAIRVTTRGTSTAAQSGPSQGIRIHHNTIDAPENNANLTQRIAIYVDNPWQTERTPFVGLWVHDNEIRSSSETVYWGAGISVHGQSGGIENVWIKRNRVLIRMQTSYPVAGAIGLVGSNAGGTVSGVYIGANAITEAGTASGSQHLGIGINAFCDKVFNTEPNSINGFWHAVRTFTNSGPTLVSLNDQIFENTASNVLLLGVALSQYGGAMQQATTTQLASLTDPINAITGSPKWAGKMVWNTTLSRPVWAVGANANSTWRYADGSTAHTPV